MTRASCGGRVSCSDGERQVTPLPNPPYRLLKVLSQTKCICATNPLFPTRLFAQVLPSSIRANRDSTNAIGRELYVLMVGLQYVRYYNERGIIESRIESHLLKKGLQDQRAELSVVKRLLQELDTREWGV